ncbi:environmental stress-induced protein Ves [Streptomyces sp. 3330]|uniref:HutD/Ves family protein n=1 Tax=Streptomyces sp. 3330 TaxID=2817755 RepID=UPI002856A8BE|nr:HutD family protein [Streptomyces sp. 3330]MDR6978182.1 environmental stress-induced protein Ves [Streptomyces sp. 3330]
MTVLLPAAGRAATAWRNGGGVTREIACSPAGAGMAAFTWRVSLAEVAADGPFSVFPGVERTLTLVEGAGMDLTVGGRRRLVDARHVPQDLPGDEPTDCRLLDGPVVNLNVMWRRGAAAPVVAVVRGRLGLRSAHALVVALDDGGCTGADGVRLARHDALLLTGEDALLHAHGPTAVVGLAP